VPVLLAKEIGLAVKKALTIEKEIFKSIWTKNINSNLSVART
jgi:hypothetical protein